MPSKYLTLMSKIGLKISLQWQNIIFFTFPNMPRWVLVKKVILGFQGSDLAVGGRGGGGCFFSCIRVKMQHFVFFGDF